MPLFDDGDLFDGSDPFAPVPLPPAPPPGYLGRYQVGQAVPLAVTPLDGGGFATQPDAAPVATVTAPGGAVLGPFKLAMVADPTHFALAFFPGVGLPLGTYAVAYACLVAGQASTIAGSFDLIPGGDPGGAVVGLFSYDRPEARFVVAQLASGRLVQGKNPRFT